MNQFRYRVKGNRCPRCNSLLTHRDWVDEAMTCCDFHCGYSRPVDDQDRILRLEYIVEELLDCIKGRQ